MHACVRVCVYVCMEGTEGSSGGMCREAPTEKETIIETVAFSRHNGASREERAELCTMARAAHKCGATVEVSDLVPASEESDQGRQGEMVG